MIKTRRNIMVVNDNFLEEGEGVWKSIRAGARDSSASSTNSYYISTYLYTYGPTIIRQIDTKVRTVGDYVIEFAYPDYNSNVIYTSPPVNLPVASGVITFPFPEGIVLAGDKRYALRLARQDKVAGTHWYSGFAGFYWGVPMYIRGLYYGGTSSQTSAVNIRILADYYDLQIQPSIPGSVYAYPA